MKPIPDWASRGACRNYDPDLWVEAVGKRQRAEAKRVCYLECPVRKECLKEAWKNDEPDGIWGGVSSGTRKKIKNRGGTFREAFKAPSCSECGKFELKLYRGKCYPHYRLEIERHA